MAHATGGSDDRAPLGIAGASDAAVPDLSASDWAHALTRVDIDAPELSERAAALCAERRCTRRLAEDALDLLSSVPAVPVGDEPAIPPSPGWRFSRIGPGAIHAIAPSPDRKEAPLLEVRFASAGDRTFLAIGPLRDDARWRGPFIGGAFVSPTGVRRNLSRPLVHEEHPPMRLPVREAEPIPSRSLARFASSRLAVLFPPSPPIIQPGRLDAAMAGIALDVLGCGVEDAVLSIRRGSGGTMRMILTADGKGPDDISRAMERLRRLAGSRGGMDGGERDIDIGALSCTERLDALALSSAAEASLRSA
ncbi:hypothetical protein WV31_10265 [Magnetospirillum sp. ME-1]|uniref:hypothetical protein n=1 Tax=Magnetospirillum sp. ME-1 TaxID=1639348 RepID=UPI000A17B0AF|nr:hypothetical protein [Magnetospirillum sp. ME-1]ARJ66010.1 hypothetical protein WV31_10265 [Magnetospirillum sp. ME-1]